ncbi:unnamed protein product, partial [Symbiodinium sp. KB8]
EIAEGKPVGDISIPAEGDEEDLEAGKGTGRAKSAQSPGTGTGVKKPAAGAAYEPPAVSPVSTEKPVPLDSFGPDKPQREAAKPASPKEQPVSPGKPVQKDKDEDNPFAGDNPFA